MKKLMLLTAVLCLLLLSGCGGLYGKAYLAEASGTVTLVRKGEESELSVSQKGLKHQDTVKTAAQSSARLRLDDGKEIVLASETEVGLFDSGKSCLLELRSGALLSRLDKPLKTSETFEITVGSLSASARESTALFSLQWLSDTEAVLNVYQGRVAVVSNRNGSELATLTAGESIHFDPVDAELTGGAGVIDYEAIPKEIAQYLEDYAGSDAEPPASPPPETAEPDGTDTPSPEPEGGAASPPAKPSPAPTPAPPPNPAPTPPAQTDPAPPPTPESPTPEPTAPGEEDGGAVILPEPEVTLPPAPTAALKYLWDRETNMFQPYLSVTWSDGRADHIAWKLCDEEGEDRNTGGTITAVDGTIKATNELLNIAAPGGGVLWPQGYAVKLTPYYTAEEESGRPAALESISLELPYLTLSSERLQGKKVPAITTNIGFWFEHSYSALTVKTAEKGGLRVTGTLYPLEGERKPLSVDVPAGH